MSDKGIWAVVLHGDRARIVRDLTKDNSGGAKELVLRGESRHLRGLIGTAGHDPGPTDAAEPNAAAGNPVELLRCDEREFAARLCWLLDAHRRSSEFDRLAVFAAQDSLQMLMSELPAALRERVFLKKVCDLIHASERELPDRIRQEIDRA